MRDGGHGDGELRAEAPDAVALVLGDAPVLHPVCHGGHGRDGPVLRRPLLLVVSGGHERDEPGHRLGSVSLHRAGVGNDAYLGNRQPLRRAWRLM